MKGWEASEREEPETVDSASLDAQRRLTRRPILRMFKMFITRWIRQTSVRLGVLADLPITTTTTRRILGLDQLANLFTRFSLVQFLC